jgi:hypothetical protein
MSWLKKVGARARRRLSAGAQGWADGHSPALCPRCRATGRAPGPVLSAPACPRGLVRGGIYLGVSGWPSRLARLDRIGEATLCG